MVEFANSKEEFMRKFLILPNGIPSEDTMNRVFSSIDSSQFETCFIDWVNPRSETSKGQVIAIDGKALRSAKSNGKKSPVHMISAWASQNNLILGQIRVNEKSNEITAIPELLDTLFVEGNIITIDAMGTQTNIAHKIIENKLHWTLDVAFSEDASRKRNNNAALNYSILLKIALNLLKNEKTEKQGITGKRLKAGWNESYLLKVLNIKV